jgi:hypothetical protein
MCLNGLQAYPALQAAVAFADFMEATQTWNADKARTARQKCGELFELVSRALASNDLAPRLYPDFETLCRFQPVETPGPWLVS